MKRSRITSAVATAAVVGGLAVSQLATAGSAFAAGGADLNTVPSGGFSYNKSTGKVLAGGLGVDFGNKGPDAVTATVTVTAVKGVHFDGKPTFKQGNKGTVKSWNAKKVVIQADLAANGDEIESFDIPATVSGKSQTLVSDVKGSTTDPDPSNNRKTAKYRVDAPPWHPGDPGKPKPTEKPGDEPGKPGGDKPGTEKPGGGKPSSEPSEANSPAPAGGSDKGGSDSGAGAGSDSGSGSGDKGDLAETGSSSNTPMLVGGAGALVLIGGAAVFAAQRRKASRG